MIVGIDIGGANLKFAALDSIRGNATSRSLYFPMWTDADALSQTLQAELLQLGRASALAVTMTGEMADCFLDREEGVRYIANAIQQTASRLGIDPLVFYSADGQFHDFQEVMQLGLPIASANWHATASWAATEFQLQEGILIDIGSTTTDLIPIKNASVATGAKTDHDRLIEGSLIYVGCGRTPVCSLVASLRFGGRTCLVMNEVFATIDDAMLVLGKTPPDENDLRTADGQPRTRAMAANRIARMVGLDRKSVSIDGACELAQQIVDAAKWRIQQSFASIDNGGTILMGGHGDALFDVPDNRQIHRFTHLFDAETSRCLPAYCVARLLASRVSSR
jgi:probable H4MPT-linked C1 transfer pathway protein